MSEWRPIDGNVPRKEQGGEAMNLKMKPCPFCGAEVDEVTPGWHAYGQLTTVVKCRCGARLVTSVNDFGQTFDEAAKLAVEKWNRRAQ